MVKKKIKVCHIITKMVYGGASLGTLHLVKHLDTRLFDCSVICGTQSEGEGNLLQNIEDRRFHVIRVPELVREINPIQDLLAFLKLITIVKKNRYDIVHSHGSKAGAIGRLAAAFCRVPVILYTVHGWGLKVGAFITRVLFRFIEKIIASFTTKILFQTRADMHEATVYKIGQLEQYALIGNGIELQPFLECNKRGVEKVRRELKLHDYKVVGTVGRVSVQKNPFGFVDIASKVLKTRQDTIFLFVGGGEMLKTMRNAVKRINMDEKIIFAGVRDDIPEVLANFDIFILPSLWEGMPRSVIEAMALSKPVIVNKIGGIEEIVQDGGNGLIVQLNHLDEFVNKVKLLLDDPQLRRKMGRVGKLRAKEFSFDEVVTKTHRLYLDLVVNS